jgi:neutral ceramidase
MTRILIAVFGSWLLAITAHAELRAGAAAVRITPDQPTPLAGYYNTRLATNTHDELHAKAIVLEQAGVKAALVVCDLLSLPRTVITQTREIIARTTGVPAANVMISATHTHTGPLLADKSSRNITDSSPPPS